MDWQLGLSIGILVYMAFVFDLFGFLARDELILRLLMLAASALYLVYFYNVSEDPLWDVIIADMALAIANLTMICIVVVERTTFSMSREDEALFSHFPMLTPGQFRRLLKSARVLIALNPVALTREGAQVDRLWFVHEGAVRIDKAGTGTVIARPMFVGELAFLTGAPASASVSAETGARYLEWDAAALRSQVGKSSDLNVALQAQFNADLVRKVTHSTPLAG